ncbi:hypothetical protein CDD82_4731 [Ophiocordyceps australis]|uniref:Calcineurin-like phosphoesterase domain-containing protein n=1 Tax=Ophiocordyceps australis TaxID=1399860 RepID=A0A2C5Z4G2_9HYPO|nr:hypothetical protein CDD82_4731 [Ophiocordyceps australis]
MSHGNPSSMVSPMVSPMISPMISPLDPNLVPTPHNHRRLIIIGDIHGMLTALDALLRHVAYDPHTDHIVAVGDVVYRGPDSPGVVDRLMALNASAVRGNHEDQVLLAWSAARHQYRQQHGPDASLTPCPSVELDSRKSAHLDLARSLGPHRLDWLARLPLILDARPLPIYIVHAGLVPGVALDKQDPEAVNTMRSLVYSDSHPPVAHPLHHHSAEPWSLAWNRWQHQLPQSQRRTVVYGHDAKRGFSQGTYTFGLDSGCVRGHPLTAMIVRATDHGAFTHTIASVPCPLPPNA